MDRNIHGYCFFCLIVVKQTQLHKTLDDKEPMRSLYHHLKLKPEILVNVNQSKSSTQTTVPVDKAKVSLCQACSQIINHLDKLLQQKEKVCLEIDYLVDKIYQQISKSSIENELRKNVSRKCSTVRISPHATVQLNRIRRTKIIRITKIIKPLGNGDIKKEPNEDIIIPDSIPEIKDDPSNLNDGSHHTDTISQDNLTNLSHENNLPTDSNETSEDSEDEIKTEKPVRPPMTTFDSKTGMHKCLKCGKDFNASSSANDHYRFEHLNISYKCKICNLPFRSSWNLKKHQMNCTTESFECRLAIKESYKHVCDICEKRFFKGGNLRQHKKAVHFNQRPFPCDKCDKKFKTATHLLSHQDIHKGISHKCPNCNKNCHEKYKYKAHLRICKPN